MVTTCFLTSVSFSCPPSPFQVAVWVNFFSWMIIPVLVVLQRRWNSRSREEDPGASPSETEPFFNRPGHPQWPYCTYTNVCTVASAQQNVTRTKHKNRSTQTCTDSGTVPAASWRNRVFCYTAVSAFSFAHQWYQGFVAMVTDLRLAAVSWQLRGCGGQIGLSDLFWFRCSLNSSNLTRLLTRCKCLWIHFVYPAGLSPWQMLWDILTFQWCFSLTVLRNERHNWM